MDNKKLLKEIRKNQILAGMLNEDDETQVPDFDITGGAVKESEETPLEVTEFRFKVKHDNGVKKLKTKASSLEAAKKIIMNAEGCPEGALELVSEMKKTYGQEGKAAKSKYNKHLRPDGKKLANASTRKAGKEISKNAEKDIDENYIRKIIKNTINKTALNEEDLYLSVPIVNNKKLEGRNIYSSEILDIIGYGEGTEVTPQALVDLGNIHSPDSVFVDRLVKAGVKDIKFISPYSKEEKVDSYVYNRLEKALGEKFIYDYIKKNNLHIYKLPNLIKSIVGIHGIMRGTKTIEHGAEVLNKIAEKLNQESEASGTIDGIEFVSEWDGEHVTIEVSYRDKEELDEFIIHVEGGVKWQGEYRAASWGYYGGSPEEGPEAEYNFTLDKKAVQVFPDGTKKEVILPDNLYAYIDENIYENAEEGVESGKNSVFYEQPDNSY